MASYSEPRKKAFKADGAIVQYTFVKGGSDKEHVAACEANEKAIGIAASAASAAEDVLEVFLFGGGGLLKLNETVVFGDSLTSTATGLGEVADADLEWCAAIAMQAGVQNDVIYVELVGHRHGQ